MSPKRGARIASDAAWLKTAPVAMAEGFTGGRSRRVLVSGYSSEILEGDESDGKESNKERRNREWIDEDRDQDRYRRHGGVAMAMDRQTR